MSKRKKINVLMVDQAITFGGSVIVMANLSNNLPDDIGVSLIYEIPEADAKYLFDDNITKRKVPTLIDYRRGRLIKEWIKKRKPEIVKKLFFKLLALITYVSGIIQIIRIARIILVDRIDVVHSNNSFSAIKAGRILKKKVIGHLHGIGPIEIRGFGANNDICISISDYIKEQVVTNYNYDERKVVVIPNPVLDIKPDIDKVTKYKQKFHIGKEQKVFGVVGRIIGWKGQLQFLDAIPHVVEKLPNVKALLIGDISDGDESYLLEVKNKIKELGIQDNVVITGYIQDVHNAIAMLDLLVHSSIEPEPFGLVITEAMIQGIPVIGSDLGAPSEIIDDGETGFIVSPFDSKTMAKNIIKLLSNDELSREFGERARAVAIKRYDVNNYAENVADVYRELCS